MPDADKISQEIREAKGVADSKNLEEYWINSVGRTLYEKFVLNYNKKMWRIQDNRLMDTFNWSAKGVALKEGPRAFWDIWISAYPYAPNGYDDYFDLSTRETRMMLETQIERFDIPQKAVWINGAKKKYDVIINTISPDILFENVYGELPYVGLDLQLLVLPMESCFPENVYFLYYANTEPFKRLVEYKRFTKHKSPTTLIGIEIPSMNGKYYPMPIKAERNKAEKYLSLLPEGVFSIGRFGKYMYEVDIDDCILHAMDVADKLK